MSYFPSYTFTSTPFKIMALYANIPKKEKEMVFPGVKKVGRALGLEMTNKQVVGKVENTTVRLYDGKNMKVLEMTFPKSEDSDKEVINTILSENKIKKCSWNNCTLKVIFVERFYPFSASRMIKIIKELANHSKTKYYQCLATCDECGDTRAVVNAYSLMDQTYFLCDKCYSQKKDSLLEEQKKYDAIPKNYLLGFVGAFLLSLLGTLVTAAMFIYAERLGAISAFIYIFLATKGYKFFKGKLDKVGAIIISITGFLMTIIGVFVAYILLIYKEVKSIELIFAVLQVDEVLVELISNIIIALLVSAVYLVINAYQMITQERYPELKRAKKIK